MGSKPDIYKEKKSWTRQWVSPLIATTALTLTSACSTLTSIQQEYKEKQLLSVAKHSSCEDPFIVIHNQDYPYGVKANASRYIGYSERIEQLSALGFEVDEYGSAECEDPRIRKYEKRPLQSSQKQRENSETSTAESNLWFQLYAIHMTPWQLEADPSVSCKATYKQHYQPPLKSGGAGKVHMVPNGNKCRKNATAYSEIPNVLQIVLSYDELVSEVDDVLASCEVATEFEDTFDEYVDSFPVEQFNEMEPDDVHQLVEYYYKLHLLHADICKSFTMSENFEVIVSRIENSKSLIFSSNCYDRDQVFLERRLPPLCRREVSLVTKIFRVYVKSLERSNDTLDVSRFNLIKSIKGINLAIEDRLSVYLSLLAKHDRPFVDVHDDLGPYNSTSMVIRFISADTLYSIKKFKEEAKWH